MWLMWLWGFRSSNRTSSSSQACHWLPWPRSMRTEQIQVSGQDLTTCLLSGRDQVCLSCQLGRWVLRRSALVCNSRHDTDICWTPLFSLQHGGFSSHQYLLIDACRSIFQHSPTKSWNMHLRSKCFLALVWNLVEVHLFVGFLMWSAAIPLADLAKDWCLVRNRRWTEGVQEKARESSWSLGSMCGMCGLFWCLGWLCRTFVVLFWVFFDLKKATEESVLVIPALTGLLSMSPWTCALPGNCRVIESWSQWPWKATTWVEALVCTQTWLRPGCRLWLPLEQLLHEAVNVNVNLFSHFTPFMFDQLDQLDQVDLWSVLGLSWPGSPHSLRKDSGVVRTACGWAACREQQHLVWMPKGS
jgi:hypothetical protein